jgi:hypothetical protein
MSAAKINEIMKMASMAAKIEIALNGENREEAAIAAAAGMAKKKRRWR